MIYTSDGRFLLGYNPRIQLWSGIGGKREAGEDAWDTAIRETMEEIYGVVPYPNRLLSKERSPVIIDQYAFYPLHIDELLASQPRATPFYLSHVTTPSQLCSERIPRAEQEIISLRLATPKEILTDLTIAEEYLVDLVEFIFRWPMACLV